MSLPTILLVDDEEDLRELWHMTLSDAISANYILAANGEQAIEIMKINQVDLIISDYRMPHKNGGELYLFNVKTKNLPFILVSGGNIEDYPEFKNFTTTNTLNAYFAKPVRLDELLLKVKLALTGKGV